MEIGINDLNGKPLKIGDKVKIANGQMGKIVYECGAFGVGIEDPIDYDKMQTVIDCFGGNEYSGVMNDNFISLWELYWNSNSDEGICEFVEIMRSEEK